MRSCFKKHVLISKIILTFYRRTRNYKIYFFLYKVLLVAKVPQNPVHINTITHPKSNNSGVNEGVNDSLIKFWYKIRLF